jgi:hypothetical protein
MSFQLKGQCWKKLTVKTTQLPKYFGDLEIPKEKEKRPIGKARGLGLIQMGKTQMVKLANK